MPEDPSPTDSLAGADYLHFGGQAIIEGVMMRSPHVFAVACRAPNGKIILHEEPLEKTWIGRQKWLMLPFLRGTWAILDAMTLGVRAMRFAAGIQTSPEHEPAVEPDPTSPVPMVAVEPLSKAETEAVANPNKSNKLQDTAIGATLFISLALGLLLFHYVPNIVAIMVGSRQNLNDARTSLITETVKIVLFIGYLALISRMREIKRVFQYHGAEHKAINALEARDLLDTPNTRRASRFHPRCGTSFAAIVFILGFIVFPFVPRPHTGVGFLDVTLRFATEIAVLPFIAGAAYEALRFAGKFRNSAA
ncbi:MAG: hypothetical protein C4320_06885, partial [Armatimonadota bacterium]